MRIGIVTQSYLPIHGGVAEHCHHLAVALRARGHDVQVITAYFNRGDENYSENVIRIGHDLTVMANGSFVNLTVGGNIRGQLERIDKKYNFDVVHIHGALDPWLPLKALEAFSCPKVATFHTYRSSNGMYAALKPVFARYARKIDKSIAVSDAAKSHYTKYFPNLDVTIIPNGVDTDRFRPDVPLLPKLNDGVDTLLFVGRMDPRKGLKYLLEAFPTVAEAHPNVRLVIVGGGILAGYYKGFVRNDLRPKVQWEGYVSATLLPLYYRSSAVYCSPATDFESFGIVLIEAMACGVPVVAYDNPGYKLTMQDGRGGVLVPNRNVPALAESLITLLKDPVRRKRMGEEGRAKALEFTWPSVAERVEAVYKEAIQKSAA